MPRFIVKLHDYYFEYSTIVDAPVTHGMTLDEFESYYHSRYGDEGFGQLKGRMDRVNKKGTSAFDYASAEDTLECNRAGLHGETLTVDEIYKAYCLHEPVLDGWIPS